MEPKTLNRRVSLSLPQPLIPYVLLRMVRRQWVFILMNRLLYEGIFIREKKTLKCSVCAHVCVSGDASTGILQLRTLRVFSATMLIRLSVHPRVPRSFFPSRAMRLRSCEFYVLCAHSKVALLFYLTSLPPSSVSTAANFTTTFHRRDDSFLFNICCLVYKRKHSRHLVSLSAFIRVDVILFLFPLRCCPASLFVVLERRSGRRRGRERGTLGGVAVQMKEKWRSTSASPDLNDCPWRSELGDGD